MQVALTILSGPSTGKAFVFDRHDTFLVGRSRNAHFQLPNDDKMVTRIHFMLEVNPPLCRLMDLGSRNGTFVNGERTFSADLKDGDRIQAGHTVLGVSVTPDDPNTAIVLTPGEDSPFMPPLPGLIPVRELARGSLGRLFLAATSPADEARAVRIVRPRQAGTQAQVDAFLAAVRPLVAFRHPASASLFAVGARATNLYFVHEHLPGEDGATHLAKQGRLPIARALRWMDALLAALEAAHGAGIVARDLRPSQIRVGPDGTVRWTSLGLARLYAESPLSGLAGVANLEAQAPFLPPEYLTDHRNPGPAGDQYAAAAVLYFLLTASPVYEPPSEAHSRLSLLFEQTATPIRTRRPEIPPALAETIHRALEFAPDRRYPSLAAFRIALRSAV